MKKVILESGTYTVDDALQGFDIIEKPSSNVAFVATCMITGNMYVQFKNGSGYMYSEVDLDTLSAVGAVDSIGKFISSMVVKKFPSEKMEKALIEALPLFHEEQATNRLDRKSQTLPITEITGFDKVLRSAGKTLTVDRKAIVIKSEPVDNKEPEF
jgi:hypothetical protein